MLSPRTINLMHYTVSLILSVIRATKTRTEDYNRAKFALKFSFVGRKLVLDTAVIRIFTTLGWRRSTVVERWSLTGELSLSYA